MVMRLFCCLLLLSAMSLQAATKLEASVDKNPVLVGEFFMLNISVDDTIRGQQPDTSALLKNFVVGPTSLSTRTNIINGSIIKQTTWSIKLMTRNAGQYTIPAFNVAGLNSDPITLTVKERSAENDSNNDIFIKTSLSSNSLFVQEAGVYSVKLYLAKELLDGNLSTPSMEDAQLTQLGKQTENYELIDGKRYLVITREYLIQPQKSGVYTIDTPVFQGRIQQNYRQLAVSALGDEQQIEIKPIPNNYQGDWLPSELVSLQEQWQPADDTVEVGTPITRTITLTALGVTKEQLPEIDMPTITGIRSYPDEKEHNSAVRNGRVVSQQTASYALLAQTAGDFTLPEISIPWFNTKINRIQYATLPERTITVLPNSNTPINAASTPTNINTAPTISDTSKYISPHPLSSSSVTPWWLIVVALLGYVLWIVTLVIFKVKSAAKTKHIPTYKLTALPQLTALNIAAKTQDTKAFYTALDEYAKAHTRTNTAAINKLCSTLDNADFTHYVTQLQADLYSTQASPANLNAIVKVLKEYRIHSEQETKEPLKALY